MTDMACKNVPGTQTTYSYLLKAEKGIGAFGTGIVFCLIAKDSDAARTVDNVKEGDCLRKAGANDVELTPAPAPTPSTNSWPRSSTSPCATTSRAP